VGCRNADLRYGVRAIKHFGLGICLPASAMPMRHMGVIVLTSIGILYQAYLAFRGHEQILARLSKESNKDLDWQMTIIFLSTTNVSLISK
jgi:hypothetical protein